MVERSNGMPLFFFFRNIQDKIGRQNVTERKKMWHPNHGPTKHAMWSRKFIHPISTNLHQFGTKMLPGTFIGYALNSGGGWTRLLIIADRHDIENNVASEVPGNRFKFKEVGIKQIAGSIHMSLRRRSLKTRRSRTTSNSTPPESRELRRGWSTSTLGEARGDRLLCARENSLQEEGGLQTFRD